MAMRIDEFDVPTELSSQQVTSRIIQWLKGGQPGTDYALVQASDTHIIINKEKRDLKICIFSGCGSCGIVFLLAVLMAGSLYYYRGYDAILFFMYVVAAVAMIAIAGGFACYILTTTKVAYVVKFGEGTPLHVTVYGEGKIEACKADYDSLKSAVIRGPPPPPAPW